jgi:predicted phage replisome organizer
MSKEIKWIKITTDIFDDEKIKLIDSMPEKDTILVIWLKLLTLAGKSNRSGYLLFSDNIPYDEEMLSTLFNRPINSIRLAIGTFKKFRMITVEHFSEDSEKEIFYISNWEKHQNIDGMEKIREQNRIRFNNYYKRKKEEVKEIENKGVTDKADKSNNISNVRTNVSLTQSNATDIEEEEDKDIDKDKRLNTEEEDFRSGEKRPAESGMEKRNIVQFNKNTNLLELSNATLKFLQDAYSDIDISIELKKMSVWLVAHPETVSEIEQFDNNFIRFAVKWLVNENSKKKQKKNANTKKYAISFNQETANLIGIDNDYINILKSKFLGINVETEIKKMEAWLFNNPSKRPAKDYPRFINRWLTQEQDKASIRDSSQRQFNSKNNKAEPQTFAEKKLQNSLNAVNQVKKDFLTGGKS